MHKTTTQWSKNKAVFDKLWSKYKPELEPWCSVTVHTLQSGQETDIQLHWKESKNLKNRNVEVIRGYSLNLYQPKEEFTKICTHILSSIANH